MDPISGYVLLCEELVDVPPSKCIFFDFLKKMSSIEGFLPAMPVDRDYDTLDYNEKLTMSVDECLAIYL